MALARSSSPHTLPPHHHQVMACSSPHCTPWTAPTPPHGMALARDKQTLKFGLERSLHSLLLLQGNSENRDIKGIDKEKKLGAKHNLKEKKKVKIHGILRIGYRYPATWYRYLRVQARLDHAMAWARRDPRPKTAP
ncbi:hypothetical protein PIB30_038267 [Stylosanthes scabra]|uniref:Uncharacterized protein n=1 Tax=Stylosanthes scabra TaxID=79078 RepID=A0ABU6XC17_9FABA|nr:hypothetical protein [Stylosanthes scabra]